MTNGKKLDFSGRHEGGPGGYRTVDRRDIRDAKMRASTELDNLIDAGTNFRTAPDGQDGHVHPNAVGDFQYFDTTFKVGNEYYKGTVNIEPVSKGLLLKDITKIENITQDISSSYGQNPKSTFLRDASMNSIRTDGENVNGPIQLNENKNKASAPPLQYQNGTAKANNRPVGVSTNASNGSVPQNGGNVNGDYFLNGNEETAYSIGNVQKRKKPTAGTGSSPRERGAQNGSRLSERSVPKTAGMSILGRCKKEAPPKLTALPLRTAALCGGVLL